ncbi:Crp/Fnr family transcriptional regulator [Noviherbaspirillum sp. CPCC 100848]|uniref:Crp/Fnr family transcriptional regulator n=1 Tax=Noviherbaspirillum album TaxID=3080276 RepID=A0ABU6JEN5_9BURK|nr:Crp/Fnr family transcriptional regulator [Noviherbaspirillum sp. CPCC 100848]MEC4722123.1 Crp/Fnr family transcriptional regulator [Noviherbaspirillum sp. CPCC 100848]
MNALFPQIAGVVPTARKLAAGTILFRQGDKTLGIFRLMSGRIALNRVTSAGTEVVMHTVRSGELFAEASIFSAHYHCDAVAIQDSEVLFYPKVELACQLKGNAEELWAFTAELAHRVQGLRARLEIRQIRSAPERVLQAVRLRCDSSGVWKVDGTLKQFAEEIGLTHEALYRALATLERERAIVRNGNEIRIGF